MEYSYHTLIMKESCLTHAAWGRQVMHMKESYFGSFTPFNLFNIKFRHPHGLPFITPLSPRSCGYRRNSLVTLHVCGRERGKRERKRERAQRREEKKKKGEKEWERKRKCARAHAFSPFSLFLSHTHAG